MFIWHSAAKFQTLGYYVCTGQNIAKTRQNFPKAYGGLEGISIILHILIYLRIRVYKSKHQISNVVSLDKKSLFTYFFNFLGIAFFVSIILTLKRIENTPVEQLLSYPHYIQFYYLHLVGTSLFILIVIASFFNNANLRRATILEIRSYFNF